MVVSLLVELVSVGKGSINWRGANSYFIYIYLFILVIEL